MRFIKVNAGDVDKIAQSVKLLNSLYGKGSHYSKWIVDGFRPFSIEYMMGQINNPSRELWVMFHNDKVVAMIIIQYEKEHGVIFHKFCVHPSHKGLGKRVMKRAEDISKKRGCKYVHVEAFSAAIQLVNYYIQHGYDKVVSFIKLEESEYVKFHHSSCSYGFIKLQKCL